MEGMGPTSGEDPGTLKRFRDALESHGFFKVHKEVGSCFQGISLRWPERTNDQLTVLTVLLPIDITRARERCKPEQVSEKCQAHAKGALDELGVQGGDVFIQETALGTSGVD